MLTIWKCLVQPKVEAEKTEETPKEDHVSEKEPSSEEKKGKLCR